MVKELFDRFDQNGNGVVTFDELRRGRLKTATTRVQSSLCPLTGPEAPASQTFLKRHLVQTSKLLQLCAIPDHAGCLLVRSRMTCCSGSGTKTQHPD
eukprot:6182422-Pleurochrysis_carterae.AAC.3